MKIVHAIGQILDSIGLKGAVLSVYDWALDKKDYIFYLTNKRKDQIFINTHATPQIYSIEDTLDHLIAEKKSLCRYGDGEFNLMQGQSIGFQPASDKLSYRMQAILQEKSDNLLVCIPGIFTNPSIYTRDNRLFWNKLLVKKRTLWYQFLNPCVQYGNTDITRCYMGLADKSQSAKYFQKLMSLWQDKWILLVEGEKSRLGVGNDLFEQARGVQRILCPAIDAFSHYNQILQEIEKHSGQADVILLALGPTATVLAYDLAKAGHYVLDIGNIDNEYEWFRAKATKKIRNPLKFSMEVPGGGITEECRDVQYTEQIIEKIEG